MENKDNFIYEVSMEDQTQQNTIEQQQWIFSNDSNNNNYSSNQIVFDLTSFYNVSSLIDWKSAYIQIPLISVVDITANTGDLNLLNNIYCLKNGFNNIINSIQVECSNSTVQQIANNLNYYNNFKVYTSKSKDWFNTAGPSAGYYGLDDPNSWAFSTDTSVLKKGFGSMNNNPTPDNISSTNGNMSVYNRLNSFLRYSTATDTTGNGADNLLDITDTKKMVQDVLDNGLSANKTKKLYYHNAIIRLGDISDFFDKIGLARCYVRLIINVNVGYYEMTTSTTGVLGTAFTINNLNTTKGSFSYNTCPFMINPNIGNSYTNATGIRAAIGIVKVLDSAGTSYQHNLSACRVYAPQITLNPEKEKIYRMNNSQKMIVWNDIFSTSVLNVNPGDTANYVISNGISRLVGVLAVPFINAKSNVGALNVGQAPPQLLPFGSEPSTTSPLMSLYNYNIVVGGKYLLPSNLIFNFNTFIDQFMGVNSLNGGAFVSGDLCSGSIDYNMWSNCYRYYYLDAERKNEADVSPKSIAAQFSNLNKVIIDVYFFVIFKKVAMLDVVSGQLQML